MQFFIPLLEELSDRTLLTVTPASPGIVTLPPGFVLPPVVAPPPVFSDINGNPNNPYPSLSLYDLIQQYNSLYEDAECLLNGIAALQENITELESLLDTLNDATNALSPQFIERVSRLNGIAAILGGAPASLLVMLRVELLERYQQAVQLFNTQVGEYNATIRLMERIIETLSEAELGGYIAPGDWSAVKDNLPPTRIEPIILGPFSPLI